MTVCAGGKTLLFDPWLIGSTYWRSWWNYPPCSQELVDSLKPDAIYITHVHWDHFAGASLRLFSPNTRIIIPKEPAGRMARDLDALGFHNYVELDHGASTYIGSIKLTSYQFYIFTDSAAVVEADGKTLLNANDAKLMGGPLKQVLKRHPHIDFVLRSHSSANSRVMYEFIDETDEYFEDRERYIDDFLCFTQATGAKYAIPFASNHCHLHKDVFGMNEYVVTPREVEEYFEQHNVASPQLKVMVSGDSWDSDNGFDIAEHDFFTNRQEQLNQYRDSVHEKLEATYRQEARSKIGEKRVRNYFDRVFSAMPWLWRRYFQGHPLLYVLDAGEDITLVEIDLYNKKVSFPESFTDASHPMQIYTRTALFKHCISVDLFSHLAISKRVKFRTTKADLRRLRSWAYFHNFFEWNLLPVRQISVGRFVGQWSRRWREVLLYFHIAANILVGKGFRFTNYLPRPD